MWHVYDSVIDDLDDEHAELTREIESLKARVCAAGLALPPPPPKPVEEYDPRDRNNSHYRNMCRRSAALRAHVTALEEVLAGRQGM